jgi:hypothetical protein
MDLYLHHRNLKRTSAEANIYYFRRASNIIILVLYVDDLLITSSDSFYITSLKKALSHEFEMKDLGLIQKILGIQVVQTSTGILLHQTTYAKSIITKYS